MPMRDRLARLVQRNPARLTLRERAASLKVSAAKVMHKRSPLPEPNSEEAKAAFRVACRLTDKLAHAAVHGYPELNRPDRSSWTKDSIWKALESGELPAVEAANLYRLAAEREARTEAAAVQANVGALHILAFADSWPLPQEEPHGEPVFKQIEAHQAAWAEMHRLTREQGNLIASDPRHNALQPLVDASFEAEDTAADTLLAGGADTLAGVLALARYLPGAMKQDSQDGERCQRALSLVCSSMLALAERGTISKGPGDAAERCAELAAVHPGFVAYPFDKPVAVLSLDWVIRNEGQRLLDLAHDEIRRQQALYAEQPRGKPWALIEDKLLRELCCDDLKRIANPDGDLSSRPPVPDFRDYSINDLYRTFQALRTADNATSLASHVLVEDSHGDGVLEDLSSRIGFLCGYIADELRTRDMIETSDEYQRADALITWEVACGDYDEAAKYCLEKHSSEMKRLAKLKGGARG